MKKLKLFALAATALALISPAAAQSGYGYYYRIQYFSDATKTTQVGSYIYLCNGAERATGIQTGFYTESNGWCD